jgi:hypothetical protein
MFRIDGPGATPDNKFTEGDPAVGTRATVVTDEWLNSVQEEIASAIEAEGLVLDKQNSSQLQQLISSRTIHVSSVSGIEGLETFVKRQVILSGNRAGTFEFDGSDLSSKVTDDPKQGIYIAPSSDPTGASGAWVRQNIRFIDPAWYGADIEGFDPTDAEWDAAIDHSLSMKLAILPTPGTYKKTASTTKDNFTGIYIFGRGAVTIDFQVDDAFKFGDFTRDVDGFFAQTAVTCRDIVFSGVKFIPSNSGFDAITKRFAYTSPLAFSSCQNVHVVDDSIFEDFDFSAIDFGAPSKDIFIQRNTFRSTEEASTNYGVRPFCYVGALDNYDDTTGQLLYPAPTVFHDNVNIEDNVFDQLSHGIISWNVHNSRYLNNTFRRPTTRTISVTNWNFDCLISGNIHEVSDNATRTLSTCIRIGQGSERIKIKNERFKGTMSGVAPNDSLKCVHVGSVTREIEIESNRFDVIDPQNQIVLDRNAEVLIDGNRINRNSLFGAPISFNGGDLATSTYEQPDIIVRGNIINGCSRVVNVIGDNVGSNPGNVIIEDNKMDTLLVNRLFATNSDNAWNVRARNNRFPLGAFNYVVNFGAGGVNLLEFDRLQRSMVTIPTAGPNVTLDWREYGGEFWYITPDQGQTIDDITNQQGDGQILTITASGNLTFAQGAFKNDGGAATIGVNDTISFISRSGVWFETSRSSN